MLRVLLIALLTGCLLLRSYAGEPVAYKIYDSKGREASWQDVVSYCKKQQVIFFGEQHDNSITHWLQLRLAQELQAANSGLILGAEMFEADQQTILNEYLSGLLSEKSFESEMRLWKNYKTDYKPLVDFALKNHLRFIATNVPRRYAAVVSKKGPGELELVSPESKKFLCPLPLKADTTLPGYRNMMSMDMGHGNSINMVYAQALKDATMAYFISLNRKDKSQLLHFNGSYHSDNFEGIVYYLRQSDKELRIATISNVEQKDPSKLSEEHLGKADFILVVTEDMTATH